LIQVDTGELIAHAPDAIIFADCTGVIRLWNRAAETMFGHGAAEAIGQTLDFIVPVVVVGVVIAASAIDLRRLGER
jgi:PAS domain-containing protein